MPLTIIQKGERITNWFKFMALHVNLLELAASLLVANTFQFQNSQI